MAPLNAWAGGVRAVGICEECGAEYVPVVAWQRFCGRPCQKRAIARRHRERRAEEGRCTKCGELLRDVEVAKFGRGRVLDPDRGPRHCRKCREYWREYRRRAKG